jgi:hypothetical protein
MPEIETAYGLYRSGDKRARGTVEAWLLARQSFAQTAARCDLTPGAVEAYHELYFNVQGQLQCWPYILCEAIGSKMWHGLTEDDVDTI